MNPRGLRVRVGDRVGVWTGVDLFRPAVVSLDDGTSVTADWVSLTRPIVSATFHVAPENDEGDPEAPHDGAAG